MNINLKNPKIWSTHLPLLIKAVEASEGDVLEIGGGLFSTPVLHWLCKNLNRKLVTYENDAEYFEFAKQFRSHLHSVRRIEDWGEMDFKHHWGVVFIDHHPELRRGIDAINFKDTADYIVMHDTEKPEKYSYDKVWQHFKYIWHDKGCRPWTSVVSNKFNVQRL